MPTRHNGSERQVRALNAFINLVRATDSVATRLNAPIEAQGLTAPQFGVLEAIYHLGPMCQKALAGKLLRSSGDVTVVVNNLEKRGWVRRERQVEDLRKIQIQLTREGRRLIERIFPQHAEDIARELSILEPEEQEELRRICRKLGKGLAEGSKGGAGAKTRVTLAPESLGARPDEKKHEHARGAAE
ncbi:MAG TPA: MarR family transcriptional regulator [Candidatus Cybelea sp.]|nr:MarR family transcriptional regulator [Candidatus Cybelea sp.]